MGAGTLRVPKRMRQTMGYLVASAEWDAGMQSSGLPVCAWLEVMFPQTAVARGRKQADLTKALLAHVDACDLCRARNAWAAEHLPPRPMPAPGLIARGAAFVFGLPAWARPAAYGAIGLGLMAGMRMLFLIPGGIRRPMVLLEALGATLLAAAAGAAGGFAFSLTRPPLARLGTAGDYISGIVATASYLGALLAVLPLLGESPLDGGSVMAFVVSFGFCTLLFGTMTGKFINKMREYPSLRE